MQPCAVMIFSKVAWTAASSVRSAGKNESSAPRLRHAPLDRLSDGPALAANVETAIARAQPGDDKTISAAWVRYVRALNAPVRGVPDQETREPGNRRVRPAPIICRDRV